jgi:hypothetical protein
MDKLTLKNTILKAQQETIDRLKKEYESYQSGGDLNLEDVRDLDDNSHREETEEYLQALETQIRQREWELEKLQGLDFGSKSSVTEGAVAQVNGQYYVIGIPACQFDHEGMHFIAMSQDAPFYQELMNKKKNDSFVFSKKQYTVESIF